jgi:16S rRNA (adenine1518-N6/adenine1519-N6)-dimethyltransferase
VDSAVVTFKRTREPEVTDKELLFEIIKAAFGQRRKTLLNCLRGASIINRSREESLQMFERLGFDENVRGENLDMDQFVALTEAITDGRRSVKLL